MPLPGLEHSDERPPDARFPTLPDAHGRLAHLRAHAPRLNERREQSQQHHRVTVWCGQPGHRREFAPAVSASISVYGMMLPRPSDRSSHLREVGASNIQTVNICRAGIVTEAVRTSTIASGARIHLYGSGIDRSAAESRLCRISGYTKLAFSIRTAVRLVWVRYFLLRVYLHTKKTLTQCECRAVQIGSVGGGMSCQWIPPICTALYSH
jgi:hypothetical protein